MNFNAFLLRRLRLAVLSTAALGAATLDGVSFAQSAAPQAQAAPTKADFDLALLDVPEGKSGEFYRERLSQINKETSRVGVNFWDARKNRLTQRNTHVATPAPPDSIEAKIFAAVLKAEKAAFNSADLPSQDQEFHFNDYLADVSEGVRDAAERYALLQELLETEKSREPVVLSRVVTICQTIADYPIMNVEPSSEGVSVDAAEIEKLVDVPKGESGAFYRDRFAALVAARWQIAGLDDARSDSLPDVASPTPQTPKSKQETALGRVDAATLRVSKFLTDAKELHPAERYYHFQRIVRNERGRGDDVARLTEILARETAKEATDPIDKRRAPFVRFELAQYRAAVLRSAVRDAFLQANPRLQDDEYWASLPREEQEALIRLARGETAYPLPPEQRDELTRLADEIIDLAQTGGISKRAASDFVDRRLDSVDAETATRVRQALLETLPADFRTQNEQTLYEELLRKIAQATFVGSVLPLEGQNVDGTPFDWAAYRGAPVLVEIFKANEQGWFDLAPLTFDPNAPNALAKYADAGLKIVRYGVGDIENVRRHVEQIRKDPKLGSRDPRTEIIDANRPVVGTFPGLRPQDDWPARFGLDEWRCWVLVDADGRVLAVKLQSWQRDFAGAPKVDKALKELYPNVDASTPQTAPQNNLNPSERPLSNPWSRRIDY
ncbi:MAG: hypothetical protein IKU86_05305 [Thermoguttaceae bacterium]|nr:hypothetical protein [Thermoguttaceae bacterium]